MKIGIITLHSDTNYGGILQCYATQQILKKNGYDVKVINCVPKESRSFFKRLTRKLKTGLSLSDALQYLSEIFHIQSGLKKKDKELYIQNIKNVFDSFRRDRLFLTPSITYDHIGEYVNDHFDAIIIGSDQVWTNIAPRQPIYFGHWHPKYIGKLYSYAACSAHASVKGKQKQLLSDYLSNFENITVRDITTQNLIKSITGKEVKIVPDPTQLYSFNEFIEDHPNTEPYILTYILGDEIKGGHAKAINSIKTRYNLNKVISIIIPNNASKIVCLSDEAYYDLSPERWVNMIANASVVYTDSFHAILFSLKFKKRFFAYCSSKIRASRLNNLKKTYQLNQIIGSAEEISSCNLSMSSIEYSENFLLELLR